MVGVCQVSLRQFLMCALAAFTSPISGYQRDLRKKVEEKLKATQKDKVGGVFSHVGLGLVLTHITSLLLLDSQSNKYKDNDKARKNYETKCREAEKIEEEVCWRLSLWFPSPIFVVYIS